MPGFLPFVLPFLKDLLKRKETWYALGAVAFYLVAYGNGKADCNAKHARLSAEAAQEWADKIVEAKDASFQDGLQAAHMAAANEVTAKEITDAGKSTPYAGDQCVSGANVGGLRELQ